MKFIPAELSLPAGVLSLSSFLLIYFWEIPEAQAHAFGQRYDLPLPFDFYLFGAGAAVALSFLMMAFFFRTQKPKTDQMEPNLMDFGFYGFKGRPHYCSFYAYGLGTNSTCLCNFASTNFSPHFRISDGI